MAKAMWELYAAYEEDMLLTTAFDPAAEVHASSPLTIPPPGGPPTVVQAKLGPFPLVYVESLKRTDVTSVVFEATVHREWNGTTNFNLLRTKATWEEET